MSEDAGGSSGQLAAPTTPLDANPSSVGAIDTTDSPDAASAYSSINDATDTLPQNSGVTATDGATDIDDAPLLSGPQDGLFVTDNTAFGSVDDPTIERDSTDSSNTLSDATLDSQSDGSSTPYSLIIAQTAWSSASSTQPAPADELEPPIFAVDPVLSPTIAVAPLLTPTVDAGPAANTAVTSSGFVIDVDVGALANVDVPLALVNAADPVSDTDDDVVNGNTARSIYDVNGTGIKVGIISDSFNALGGAAADEADGALPPAADVDILKDATGSGETDEGRAMAQIVHSIAPGAQIYFYTDGNSDADMATAISALQSAGCQIIIDDVIYLDEPFYEENGVISAAINSVVADGSTYLTAANNSSDSFYEGTFTPLSVKTTGGSTVLANNFGTTAVPTIYEPITLPEGLSTYIDLQWNQPFLTADGAASGPGSANSLAFELLNSSFQVVAAGNADDVGGDPLQLTEYGSSSKTGSSFYLVVYENESAGPTPGEFKIVLDNDSADPPTVQNGGVGSGTVIGHEEDPNAITVGAAPENDPTAMENYSAYGPGEFLFNGSGVALTSPVSADKINVVAPDGNSTGVSDLNPFYGTSAATPAAAAVAALMLQANAALDPSDVENILEDTGTPIAGNPDQTGSGMVNADEAVGASETLTFDESANVSTLLGTHLGATFVGGAGSHTLVGEGGVNVVDYEGAPAAVTVNFVTDTASNGFGGTDSFSGIQEAEGSAYNDTFVVGTTGETLLGGGGTDSLNFAALAAGGVVDLIGGSFAANTATSGINAGTIDVQDACTLQISGSTLGNAGLLEAQAGGDLDIACSLSGSGSSSVGGNAILELGSSDSEAVNFSGSPATLKLDAPSSFSGTISGLALGDVIDLVNTSVTSAKVVGSTLSITLSGGSTLTYQVAGALSGNSFAPSSDNAGGTDLTLTAATTYSLAQATLNTSSPIVLGKARVGGTLSEALSITNSAAPPAEALDASIGSTTGSATGTGTINLLAAGGTDTTDVVVGVSTATAGPSSGSVTLAFASDGSNTDGNGKTALASQTVQVSGAVYREAAASTAPINVIVHVGSSGSQALSITNSAASDGYSEDLIATVASSTGVSASGSTGDIAAGSTSSAIAVSFSTAQAGTVSGSVTLGLSSDGTGIDGFGPTSIGQQVVAVNATVDNYAVAALEEVSGGGTWSESGTSYTLSLGTLAQGAVPVTVDLGALNNVAGPADLLSGSFVTSVGSAFTLSGFGAFSGLAAGQADLTPSVTFSTSTAGSFSETITLDPTGSNASGYSGALAAETLTITGAVASKAQATINTVSPISLGKARIGGTLSEALSISNSATTPAEALDASIGSTTGSATGTGTINLLAAGATDTTDVVVGVSTSVAGTSSGSVTLAFASDGSNTDGSGKTALASQTVQVSGAIYREATASVGGLPANFIVHVGSAGSQSLSITNSAATDGYSENLVATVASSTGVSASGSTGDIAAGGTSSAIAVNFSTAQAGTVSGSVTVGLSSDGTGIDGFGPTSIGQQVVAVNATVDNYAVAALEEVSGGGTWSQSGTSYTLSLGTLAEGSSPVAIALGVLNNVTGPADLLSGSFATSGGSAFTLSGFGAFSGLAAGQADVAPSVTLSTATDGNFSETITLDPTGSNASGYSGALAPETLTITGTVEPIAPVLTNVVGQPVSGSPIEVQGTGEVGDAITLYADGGTTPIGSGVVGASGTFTITTSTGVSAGPHVLTATETDSSNAASAASTPLDVLVGNVWAGPSSGTQGKILGGSWVTAADWSGGVPVAGDLAILDTSTTAYTVTSSAGVMIGGLIVEPASGAEKVPGLLDITGGTFTISGGSSNAGTVEITSKTAVLDLYGAFADTTAGLLSAATSGATVDLVGGSVTGGTLNIVKGATVEASGGGSSPSSIIGTLIKDQGLLEANSGTTLTLGPAVSVSASGGTIEASGSSSVVVLDGAGITSGTLISTASGAIATVASTTSTLAGATVSSGSTVAVTDGSGLDIQGTTADTGTIGLDSTGDATDLLIAASGATLSTAGSVLLSNNDENFILAAATGAILTNSAATISGAGEIGAGDGALTLINKKIMNATGSNLLVIDTDNVVTNSGTLEATGTGTLALDDSVGNGGTITALGTATVSLNGVTITNTTAGIVSAGAAGASVILDGGTIVGGTVKTVAGATILAEGTTVISGATVTGAGTLEASGGTLTLSGGTVNNSGGTVVAASGGAIALSGTLLENGTLKSTGGTIATVAGTSSVFDNQTVAAGTSIAVTDGSGLALQGTIADTGTIALNSVGDATDLLIAASGATLSTAGSVLLSNSPENFILAAAAGAILTNSAATISGAGEIGASDGALTLINKKIINATDSNPLVIDTGDVVTNSGTLEATGGSMLALDDSASNSGTINALGTATVSLNGVTITDTTAGIVSAGAAGASVDLDAGTIVGGAVKTVAGATILAEGASLLSAVTVTDAGSLESSGGTLTLSGGTVNAAGGSVIAASGGAIELSGTFLETGTLASTGGTIATVAGTSTIFDNLTIAAGTSVSVTDGSTLELEGTITNDGTIALDATGDPTKLLLGANTTLQGSGTVSLANIAGSADAILGSGAAKTLTDTNDLIEGAGAIGDGDASLKLSMKAGSTIDANATNALVLDTGNAETDAGLIEATGSGGLTIDDTVSNTGTLAADGGTLTALNSVTGAGKAEIFSASLLDFAVGDANAVTFENNAGDNGVLALGNAADLAGTVAGFFDAGSSSDTLDLQTINFASGVTWSFTQSATAKGVLTVKDGTGDTANITLLAHYIATGTTATSSSGSPIFQIGSDDITHTAGTLVTTSVHI